MFIGLADHPASKPFSTLRKTVTMEIGEKYLISIAHALYSTRLHVLTLTEVVRLGVKPDGDGLLRLPPSSTRK